MQQLRVVGQFKIVHARFLAPLVKARGFGMTPPKTRARLTHYRSRRKALSGANFLLFCLRFIRWQRRSSVVRSTFPGQIERDHAP